MKETKKFVEKQANFIVECAVKNDWSISYATDFAESYLRKYPYSDSFILKVQQLVVKELIG